MHYFFKKLLHVVFDILGTGVDNPENIKAALWFLVTLVCTINSLSHHMCV